MQAVNAEVNYGALANLHDFIFNVFGCLATISSMQQGESTILNQTVQGQPGNLILRDQNPKWWWLPAYRHKHNFNTGCSFQCSDVSPFTTDDFSFDVIALMLKIDTQFSTACSVAVRWMVSQHLLGFFSSRDLGLFHNVFNVAAGSCLRFFFSTIQPIARGLGRLWVCWCSQYLNFCWLNLSSSSLRFFTWSIWTARSYGSSRLASLCFTCSSSLLSWTRAVLPLLIGDDLFFFCWPLLQTPALVSGIFLWLLAFVFLDCLGLYFGFFHNECSFFSHNFLVFLHFVL